MKGLASSALAFGLGCASARMPLPPSPPPLRGGDRLAWQTPPPLAPEPVLHVEWQLARVRLDNGLGVSAISRPNSAFTSIALWVPSAADTSQGAVAVMIEALRAGTWVSSDRVLYDPRLARQALSLRTSGAGSTFSWQVLPSSAERALVLLADFVGRPVFDPAQTRVVLQQRLAAIQRDSGGPRHLANLARAALPGIDIDGPESDARGLFRLTRERLGRLHGCSLRPEGAELVVVGPADAGELLNVARDAFARFQPRSSARSCAAGRKPVAENRPPARGPLELQIVYGGSFDPWLVLVTAGPAPQSDEFLPFALLSRVLDSRDSGAAELRHRGATYGIHARLNEAFPGRSLLEFEGQVAPESAQASLRTLVEDMRNLSETLEAGELEEVKRRWRNEFIASLSNNVAVAQHALAQVRRGRSPAALAQWPEELGQISLERCRQVAKKWLSAAAPSIAVAGLPVKLVRGLGMRANVRRLYWTDRLSEPKKAL